MAEPATTTATAQPQEAAKPPVEKQTNCLACNKPLKRIKLYYRDGKFYCTKKCWMKFKESQKQKSEEGK